jgi:hypothetical protein
MNPYKLSQVYKQLTSQNSILKKYLKLGTKDIKQPDLPAFVEQKNMFNRFMRDNPRPDQIDRKDMAGGGMLVQPSADGSRPGYAKVKSVKNVKGKDRTTFVRSPLDENQLSTFKNYLNQRDDINIPDLDQKSELEIKKWFDSKDLSNRYTQIKSDIKQGKISFDVNVGDKIMSPDRFKQLNWIATNSKRYTDPNKFINDFKTKFKVKDLSEASLFSEATLGGGQKNERRKITLNVLNDSKNKITSYGTNRNYFTFLPGYSEAELFKAAMVQNNPQVVKNLKNSFNLIEKEFLDMKNMMSEKGVFTATVEEALELKLKGKYKYLNNFDILPGTTEDPGLLGRGIFRTSLENNGISPTAMSMYSALNMNNNYMSNIIKGLETNPDAFGTIYQLKPNEIKKVINGWKKVESGQASAKAWVDQMDKVLGEKGFNNLFGNVIFEHKVAKKFGKTWTYFPRDYLLQGQFSNSEFNTAKFNAFDKPMIKLIQKYENAPLSKKPLIKLQMETLLSDFNKVSNNYMGDYGLNFDDGKFKFVDKSERTPFGNANRYAKDKTLAAQEMYDTATKGFDVEKLKETKFRKEQINAIQKYDLKQKELLAKIGCPNKVFKASGGRVGYQDGTDICPTRGANLINSGMKNATPAQLKNFAAFANRARALGKGVMKFGIIPEAMYVAADATIRLTMGDKPIEALLRASEYLLPGDQTKLAEMMEAKRLMNPETAAIIGRSIDYKNQLAKIQSLEDTRDNLELLSGGGEFDYIGDSNNDVKNLNNQIKQATDALNTKFKMTDAELAYANAMQNEVDAMRGANSFLTKLQSKFRDTGQDASDIETLGAPEVTQEQLNKRMLPQLDRDLLLASEEEMIQAAKIAQLQGFDIPDDYYIKEKLKTKNVIQNMSLAELAAATSPEAVYGFQGHLGEPLNKGVVEKPQNVISDMANEIVGQTNVNEQGQVINPFDLDLSMIGSGLRGFSAAGGGIAKEAGVDSGAPPQSGPNPQGLSYLMKRGKNI